MASADGADQAFRGPLGHPEGPRDAPRAAHAGHPYGTGRPPGHGAVAAVGRGAVGAAAA